MEVYPHRIRLRGPWEYEAVTVAGETARGRLKLPVAWADSCLGEFPGRVRLLRRFGAPGRVDDYERLWLTGDGTALVRSCTLNGSVLGSGCPFEYEVTALVRPRNELKVEVEGGLWDEIALEVRRAAFLRGVDVQVREGAILVTGDVVGTSARPLELYVVVNRRTIAYRRVEASPLGEPFRLEGHVEPGDSSEGVIQVDLIDGGEVWFREQLTG